MKIDLTCPVELWRYELPTEQFAVCTLLLYNLSDKAVTSVQVTLACYDGDGQPLSRMVERMQGFTAQPKSNFEIAVPMEEGVKAADMELTIEKVWFDDGIIWRRGSASLSEYTPNTLPNNRSLEMLRYIVGSDAVGYPEDQGAVWLCVCGRANAASEEFCRRCQRSKAVIFQNYDRETVEEMVAQRERELSEKAKKARAEASKRQLEREEKIMRRRKRRKRAVISVVTVVVVATAGYFIYFHGIPYYKYYMADRELENGLYLEAKTAFLAMGDYRDAEEKALEADYRRAEELMAIPTIESLQNAQDIFHDLNGYRDSVAQINEAIYRQAGIYMDRKDYAKAVELYSQIANYADSHLKQNQAKFYAAEALMQEGQYEEARKQFTLLGEFDGAKAKAEACTFEMATLARDSGDFETAIDMFNEIPGYDGVADLLVRTHYAYAEQLYAKGEYDKAGEQYLLCGDYLKAHSRVIECIYEPAVLLMDQGNYEQAYAKFEQIRNMHAEAGERANQCLFLMGVSAEDAGDLEAAQEYFAKLPADYQDGQAQARLQSIVYRQAESLALEGNFEAALAKYATIPDYQDTADKVRDIRYKEASNMMQAKEYDKAIAAYLDLDGYMESHTRLGEAYIAKGESLYEQKNYTEAMDAFMAANEYINAAESINKTRYAMAEVEIEKGQVDNAIILLKELVLAQYSGAQGRLNAIYYDRAAAAYDGKDYETAASLFGELGSFGDAPARFQASTYEVAAQMESEGQLSKAGQLFASVSGYSDAAARSEAAFDAYYATTYQEAQGVMNAKDYVAVVDMLSGLELDNVPAKYKELRSIYQEANYLLANALYAENKPYEALVYYRNILDYKDVSTKRLDKNCYNMLGKWVSEKGVVMEFRDNGTCNIDGEELYFTAKNYAVYTGLSPAGLTKQTHKIVRLDADRSMSISDIRDKNKEVVYRMTRAD